MLEGRRIKTSGAQSTLWSLLLDRIVGQIGEHIMRTAQAPASSAALSSAMRSIDARPTVQETLDAIVYAARDTVPGFNHVGISVVRRDGTVETRAATDQYVVENDALQYELGEGPCMQAMAGNGIVLVEHAAHEQRWPAYIARALRTGLQAQMGLQLYNHQGTLGGLNLYSTDHDTIDPDAPAIAELFAAHAATVLGHVREVTHLREAITTRQVIGQATGVIMERYGMTPDKAFAYLIRLSSTSNIKLRDVATAVLDQAASDIGARAH
jgi:GAF domain-containing protein